MGRSCNLRCCPEVALSHHSKELLSVCHRIIAPPESGSFSRCIPCLDPGIDELREANIHDCMAKLMHTNILAIGPCATTIWVIRLIEEILFAAGCHRSRQRAACSTNPERAQGSALVLGEVW